MRATRPVSINGIEFDALISESRTLESTVPEYPVESGFSVSDSIILNSEKLEMTLYLTNSPVTWKRRFGSDPKRVENVLKQLEELYFRKTPVTVITTDATYTDMAISNLTLSKSVDEGYAREIPISFQKVRITNAKTTSIPASYGKSGKSGASAGTASTSTETAAIQNGNESESGGENKSSILYGLAKATGLMS